MKAIYGLVSNLLYIMDKTIPFAIFIVDPVNIIFPRNKRQKQYVFFSAEKYK